VRRILVAVALMLVLAAPAGASEERPTLAELESRVVCPTCETTIDQSRAPVANSLRRYIGERIAAGDSRSEIEAKLVADFGEAVLASPPRRGFTLLAWVLPLLGLALGAVVVGSLAWRWSRGREPRLAPVGAPGGSGGLEPELERRLDEELRRYDP